MGMHPQRLADLDRNVIREMGDTEIKRISWWLARAEQLAPIVEAEITKRGI